MANRQYSSFASQSTRAQQMGSIPNNFTSLGGARNFTSETKSTHPFYLEESMSFGTQGLLLDDTDLLSKLSQQISFLRQSKIEGLQQEDLQRRLQWIDTQIAGLVQKSLSIKTTKGATDYYSVVRDLQDQIDKLTLINNSYERSLAEANKRLLDQEAEISKLRESIFQIDDLKYESELYRSAFREISQIVNDKSKMKDFEKTISEKITPLVNSFEFKLDGFLGATTEGARQDIKDPKIKLRGEITGLLKNFDRILKSTDEVTIDSVEEVITGFLKEMQLTSNYKYYLSGKLLVHQFEDLQKLASANASLFKSRLELLLKNNPSLAAQIDMSQFDLLQKKGIQLQIINGVVTIDELYSGKVIYYLNSEARTKKLLELLSRQFKILLKKFPFLKAQLHAQVLEFASLSVYRDANAIEELDRIFEIVKYQPQLFKVENVYQLDTEKHAKAIFYLKFMVKALLERLLSLKEKFGLALDIDEGLLGMIQAELVGIVDVDDVLCVFRTLPKILEVERVIEKDIGKHLGYLTQGHAVNTESLKVVDRSVERPVIMEKQVPLIIEKGVTHVAIKEVPVEVAVEKIVEVNTGKERIVEKHVLQEKIKEVPTIRQVPVKETQIKEVEKTLVAERYTEVPKEINVQVEVPIKEIVRQIIEVPRYEERLVEVLREITHIQQVKIKEEVPVQIIKYVEVEKIINNFINKPQIIEIKEEIPVFITKVIEKPVEVVNTIEKVVEVIHETEKIVEVPVQTQVPLVQEVKKDIIQKEIVQVKGNIEEIIKYVDRIQEVPVFREKIVTKDVEIEKAVPVWVSREVPVTVEVSVPYIQKEPELVYVNIERFIPYRQEIPAEIIKQIPVPIIIQKEVIKQVRVMTEKIVEKIVEVPRVVQVEKIVEKIVVVPRIIENIKHVPQIIEKLVQREVEVLKIVEIEKQVPVYLTKEVKEIVTEKVPYLVEKKEIQIADKEKVVAMYVDREVIKEVPVERRIPVEVMWEKEVPLIKEKYIDRLITVRDIEVVDRQVMVPMRQEIPVELIQEKAVEVRTLVEKIVQVPQIITKNVIVRETVTVPEIQKIHIDRPIETQKEVIRENFKNLIQQRVQYRNITQEKLVRVPERIEVLKPEPYIVEKIVSKDNIYERAVPINSYKALPLVEQVLVPLRVPVNHFLYNQVAKQVMVHNTSEVRTLVSELEKIQVQGPERIVAVDSGKPQYHNLKEQVIRFQNKEVEKQLYTQKPYKQTAIQVVQVEGKTKLVSEFKQTTNVQTEQVYAEKVVERILLLPQVLELIKHIHHVGEIGLDGVAVGVDIQVHIKNYLSILVSLQTGLEGFLAKLKSSAQSAEIKLQITLIEQLLPILINLIKFPLIIEVPKEKIIEKEKIVGVPYNGREYADREVTLIMLIQRLIAELKRIQKSSGDLKFELDLDILNVFFLSQNVNFEAQLDEFILLMRQKFVSWSETDMLLIKSFMEERFQLINTIRQYKLDIEGLRKQIGTSKDSGKIREQVAELQAKNSYLVTINSELNIQINSLYIQIETLKKNFDMTEAGRTIKMLEEQNTKLKASYQQIKFKHDSAFKDMTDISHVYRQKMENLEEQTRKQQEKIKAQHNQLIKVQRQLDISKSQIISGAHVQVTTQVGEIRHATSQKTTTKEVSSFEKSTKTKAEHAQQSSSSSGYDVHVRRFEDEPSFRQTVRYSTPVEGQRSSTKTTEIAFGTPMSSRVTQVTNIRTLEPQNIESRMTQRITEQNIKPILVDSVLIATKDEPKSPVVERKSVSLRELMGLKLKESIITKLMTKIINQVKEQSSEGKFLLYSPDNIQIDEFSTADLSHVKIQLKQPLKRENQLTQTYLSPEVIRGQDASESSIVFNLGLIWDEFLHGRPFFKTVSEIESDAFEYKVRNNRIAPITKNLLYQMLNKLPEDRVPLKNITDRLGLMTHLTRV